MSAVAAAAPRIGENGPKTCESCGAPTKLDHVSVVLGDVTKLTVVEHIPAFVCTGCGEQYYATDTADAIERMVKNGFPSKRFVRQLIVPVYSFQDDPEPASAGADQERQTT